MILSVSSKQDTIFECDCGAETEFQLEKPRKGHQVRGSLVCHGCGSTYAYILKLFRGHTKWNVGLAHGTRALVEALEAKKRRELLGIPELKAPQFFMPKGTIAS